MLLRDLGRLQLFAIVNFNKALALLQQIPDESCFNTSALEYGGRNPEVGSSTN